MKLSPYLAFNGQCAEAFELYARVLGGEITFSMTWGEMPGADQFPAELHPRIMHTTLRVGDEDLMGADAPPDGYHEPKGMNVSIQVRDKTEGERIFNALAEGGTVTMPFGQTFWSQGFGMCVDRFGTPWMVNSEQPPEE